MLWYLSLWRTPRFFCGPVPRHAMQSSYLKWSEAPLIGTTQTVLTGLGGPMPKNIVKRNLDSVNYFSTANVSTPRIVNLVEKFKNISVLFALVKVELLLTLKSTVIFTKNLQKTSKELLS